MMADERVDSLEKRVRRLEEDTMAARAGSVSDAKVWAIAIGVLAIVSLGEAVAIIALWWSR
ncbi:hypothetical protein ACLBXO_22175 [Methylobacterium sp. C33D]